MSLHTPKDISVNQSNKEMTIEWDDGHVSVYSFSLLRHSCPCAECRGGHEKMGSEPDPVVFDMPDEDVPATRLKDVAAVGTYGITITWEDGHDFGIYTWKYLRALCPCSECRAKHEKT